MHLGFQMENCRRIICFLVLVSLVHASKASPGDANPLYRDCVSQCEKSGRVEEKFVSDCKFPSDAPHVDGPWYMQELLYLRWKRLVCLSDCRYHCMLHIEGKRAEAGQGPVKYHGKWPFLRLYGFQEPASVAFSALNLAMHFHGWLSFSIALHYKLPLNANNKPLYDYTSLWNFYGLFSMNSWLWSAVFHSLDVDLTEKLDYSSAVALLGYSLLLSIIRSFNLRNEAARVMVAAPVIAFTTTHILYLNIYKMDYGWNMTVCIVMAVAQLLVWAIWAFVSGHPARWKLWAVVFGGGLAMLLEVFDFPPFYGFFDAHSLWHACTVPLTYVWWSFIKDDAVYRTSILVKKVK